MGAGHGGQPSRQAKQDDSVMGTNNSSIVSKRSVERLYHRQPHFFRYFVEKPQRRSPLINRGYWLRMQAVEVVVRRFLEEPSEKPKIVLNLGSGYDPLPFQWLSRDHDLCSRVTFVDVDYPQLMRRKVELIRSTPQLGELIQDIDPNYLEDGVYLKSPHYYALGCDLADIRRLNALLREHLDVSRCMMLCIAEVSVTYMNVDAADALIAWAATNEDVRFCLLEQFLPDGPKHPFAFKMIKHFDKLQTPLRSIHKYPTLHHQRCRFERQGWRSVSVQSLWRVWSDESIVPVGQRNALEDVEPFDEWEEFILFASHYFLLVASLSPTDSSTIDGVVELNVGSTIGETPNKVDTDFHTSLRARQAGILQGFSNRRFGALFKTPICIGFYGGLGTRSRTNTTALLESNLDSQDSSMNADKIVRQSLPHQVMARMCHTISSFKDGKCLLVGGRVSPDRPLQDCWFFDGGWRQVDDLPFPLYRHSATGFDLGQGSMEDHGVMVYGGKTTNNTISGRWLLWQYSVGWRDVTPEATLSPAFGAAMVSTGLGTGVVIGGMIEAGVLTPRLQQWTLSRNAEGQMQLTIARERLSGSLAPRCSARFGAQVVLHGHDVLLIGGVSIDVLSQRQEIVRLRPPDVEEGVWTASIGQIEESIQRPLFVGHSVSVTEDYIIIVGGGAVCFSFGTFWNERLQILSLDPAKELPILSIITEEVDLHEEQKAASDFKYRKGAQALELQNPSMPAKAVNIPRLSARTNVEFRTVLDDSHPAVLVDLDMGTYLGHWNLPSLKNRIGAERNVVVHEASTKQMSFAEKNFRYSTKSFGEFADQISEGSQQYLRSLSTENPSSKPANICNDFPEIASEFTLPPQLDFVAQNIHSSILRISGPVNMWLHYDVMANILCQMSGTKRLLLYPPSDVQHLAIAPGASSSSIDVFDHDARLKHPSLESVHDPHSVHRYTGPTWESMLTLGRRQTQPQEVILRPGDVLYIPPFWLHAANPLDTISISVNVFFRSFNSGYAPGRDVYGNRDLQAYEKGRNDVQKIAKAFERFPRDVARFYLERLAAELKEKAT